MQTTLSSFPSYSKHDESHKLGIWIEDVNINDFSNEHIKRLNHKIAQLSVQESIFSNEKEAVIYTDKYVPAASKRYAITNEIAQYIFHKDDKKIYKCFSAYLCHIDQDYAYNMTYLMEFHEDFLIFLEAFNKKYKTVEQLFAIAQEYPNVTLKIDRYAGTKKIYMSEESAFHWISHLLTQGYRLHTKYEIKLSEDNKESEIILAPKTIIEKLILGIVSS